MLTEERYATILRILEEKKAVTVLELTKALHASSCSFHYTRPAPDPARKFFFFFAAAALRII